MVATGAYMLVFRIVHILAGVAWAGSVFLFVIYVQPSAAAIGPAGAPFMTELLAKRKLTSRLIELGSITVVGGLFLYWRDWQLYESFGDWIGTSFGVIITIGALAAIAGLAIGVFVTRPNVLRLLALGTQAAEAGGPPPPELAAEIARTQARLKVFARATLGLIALSVLAMATARYW